MAALVGRPFLLILILCSLFSNSVNAEWSGPIRAPAYPPYPSSPLYAPQYSPPDGHGVVLPPSWAPLQAPTPSSTPTAPASAPLNDVPSGPAPLHSAPGPWTAAAPAPEGDSPVGEPMYAPELAPELGPISAPLVSPAGSTPEYAPEYAPEHAPEYAPEYAPGPSPEFAPAAPVPSASAPIASPPVPLGRSPSSDVPFTREPVGSPVPSTNSGSRIASQSWRVVAMTMAVVAFTF